jgi:glucan phosphorylase
MADFDTSFSYSLEYPHELDGPGSVPAATISTFADAQVIYELLEKKVIPLYYDVSADGVPHGWGSLMKSAMKSIGRRFSAQRMAKEYISKFYGRALKKA